MNRKEVTIGWPWKFARISNISLKADRQTFWLRDVRVLINSWHTIYW